MPEAAIVPDALVSDAKNHYETANGNVTVTPGDPNDNSLVEMWKAFHGPLPLTIAKAIPKVLSDGASIKGTVNFFRQTDVGIDALFKRNGDFTLQLTVSSLTLRDLLTPVLGVDTSIARDQNLPNAWVVMEREGSEMSVTAAAKLGAVGQCIVKLTKAEKWQVVAGLDFNVTGISAIPSLAHTKITAFDNFIGLSDLMLVLASATPSNFEFPNTDAFDAPAFAVGSGKIALPAGAGGLAQGLNLYGKLDTANGKGFQALAKFLKLSLDGSLTGILSLSLPNPEQSAKAFVSFNEVLLAGKDSNHPGLSMAGTVGGVMQNSQLGVFLSGTASALLQGQTATFTLNALALESGVLISGSMTNTAPLQFSIGKSRFNIANLGLVVGLDDDGIPSIGMAATMGLQGSGTSDGCTFSGAFFIDTVTPKQSMFTGALSGFSVLSVAKSIAGQADVEKTVGPVLADALGSIGLKDINGFTVKDASFITSLNGRKLIDIAATFKANGITIPGTSDMILLEINQRGVLWYLTDLNAMMHYTLRADGSNVVVSLQPQIYCAPQATNIGALSFPQGFHVDAEIDVFLLSAQLRLEVLQGGSGIPGIAADVSVKPISLGGDYVFRLTDASGVGGPTVSLATISQDRFGDDPFLKNPHLLISGAVSVLGVNLSKTYLSIGKTGLKFDISQTVGLVKYDLHGSIDPSASLTLGGTLDVGINQTLSLGELGYYPMNAHAQCTLDLQANHSGASASVSGNVSFRSSTLSFGPLTLDVKTQAAVNLVLTVANGIIDAAKNQLLQGPASWISAVQSGEIQAAKDITVIANLLHTTFGRDAQEAGTLLVSANFAVTDVLNTLTSYADFSAQAVVGVMSSAKASLSDILSVVKGMFSLSNKDIYDLLVKANNLENAKVLQGYLDAVTSDLSSVQTFFTDGSFQNDAKQAWNTLENAIGSLANKGISSVEYLVGYHPDKNNAKLNAAIATALGDSKLSTPSIVGRQYSFMSPLGKSAGNDLLLAALDPLGNPYLVTWLHVLGGGWKAGRVLPAPDGVSFSSLTICPTRNNDTQLVGLAKDGRPYVISYLPGSCLTDYIDRRIGWKAGTPLPCPIQQNKFTSLRTGTVPSGDLWIVGLGVDKKPYLISWFGTNGWNPGQPLACPPQQNQFKTIGSCTTRNGTVQIYGIGVDNVPYIIAYYNNGWSAGVPLPLLCNQRTFQQMHSAGPNGESFFIGLGTDGKPYLMAAMNSNGSWQQPNGSSALPTASQMASLTSLNVGSLSNGDFQVFGLDVSSRPYIVCYRNSSNNWSSGIPAPSLTQQNQFTYLTFNEAAANGDDQIAGLGVDGKAYLAFYHNEQGWHPGVAF